MHVPKKYDAKLVVSMVFPELSKQEGIVEPVTQVVPGLNPHLHVLALHIDAVGSEQGADDPHMQLPAVQVGPSTASQAGLHVTRKTTFT